MQLGSVDRRRDGLILAPITTISASLIGLIASQWRSLSERVGLRREHTDPGYVPSYVPSGSRSAGRRYRPPTMSGMTSSVFDILADVLSDLSSMYAISVCDTAELLLTTFSV
jgi:hypothetical protein